MKTSWGKKLMNCKPWSLKTLELRRLSDNLNIRPNRKSMSSIKSEESQTKREEKLWLKKKVWIESWKVWRKKSRDSLNKLVMRREGRKSTKMSWIIWKGKSNRREELRWWMRNKLSATSTSWIKTDKRWSACLKCENKKRIRLKTTSRLWSTR